MINDNQKSGTTSTEPPTHAETAITDRHPQDPKFSILLVVTGRYQHERAMQRGARW